MWSCTQCIPTFKVTVLLNSNSACMMFNTAFALVCKEPKSKLVRNGSGTHFHRKYIRQSLSTLSLQDRVRRMQ